VMHAAVRAEGAAPFRHLDRAPAAKATAIGSARESAVDGATSRHGAAGAHVFCL
jgi:hypothetical protein